MSYRDFARSLIGRPTQASKGEIRLPQGSHEIRVRYVQDIGDSELLDQLQEYALHRILDAAELEADGWYLRWQTFTPEPGAVHQRRTHVGEKLEFRFAEDERGIELLLPGVEEPYPWVPVQPQLEPGTRQLATLDWHSGEPELSWRYVRLHRQVALEATWACPGLFPAWVDLLRDKARPLDCTVSDTVSESTLSENAGSDGVKSTGNGADNHAQDDAGLETGEARQFRLEPMGEDLIWRGTLPLPTDAPLSATRTFSFTPPLVVYPAVDDRSSQPEGLVPRRQRVTLPLRLEAIDLLARIGGRRSRLVAEDEGELPFSAELVTRAETVLPPRLPVGLIQGLPWPLEIEDLGPVDGYGPQSRHGWRLDARPREGGPPEADPEANPEASPPDANPPNTSTDTDADPRGLWKEVHWGESPPSLQLDAVDPLPPGAPASPTIYRIARRKASVAWQLRTSGDDELLCLTVPRWLPAGAPALPGLTLEPRGFDYAGDLRAELDGVEERFSVDQESELAPDRLFLDPDRWRFRNRFGRPIGGEALGSAGGYARWRRPRADRHEATKLPPTEWAAGSAPVLIVGKERMAGLAHQQDQMIRRWGALYSPEPVQWSSLRPVEPSLRMNPSKALMLKLRPKPPAIWISLWGFICSYDRRELSFARAGGGERGMIAWVSRTGLPLFPRDSEFLLRSFSPLYAVKDDDPRRLDLLPGTLRPTLYMGRSLFDPGVSGQGGIAFRPGASTRCRTQITDGAVFPSHFGVGLPPGQTVTLRENLSRRTLWIALEQPRPALGQAPLGAGYLLSWNAKRGWYLRGYFAEPGAAVELGRAQLVTHESTRTSDIETLPVLLSDAHHGQGAFTITLTTGPTAEGESPIAWSDNAPQEVRDELDDEALREWGDAYWDPAYRPIALEPYEVLTRPGSDPNRIVIECIDRTEMAAVEQVLGIRVWEDYEESTAEARRAAGTQRLETSPRRLHADDSTSSLSASPDALRTLKDAGSLSDRGNLKDAVIDTRAADTRAGETVESQPDARFIPPIDDEDDF